MKVIKINCWRFQFHLCWGPKMSPTGKHFACFCAATHSWISLHSSPLEQICTTMIGTCVAELLEIDPDCWLIISAVSLLLPNNWMKEMRRSSLMPPCVAFAWWKCFALKQRISLHTSRLLGGRNRRFTAPVVEWIFSSLIDNEVFACCERPSPKMRELLQPKQSDKMS